MRNWRKVQYFCVGVLMSFSKTSLSFGLHCFFYVKQRNVKEPPTAHTVNHMLNNSIVAKYTSSVGKMDKSWPMTCIFTLERHIQVKFVSNDVKLDRSPCRRHLSGVHALRIQPEWSSHLGCLPSQGQYICISVLPLCSWGRTWTRYGTYRRRRLVSYRTTLELRPDRLC